MVGIEGGNGGWEKMTEEERKISSRGMEIYAAVSLSPTSRVEKRVS